MGYTDRIRYWVFMMAFLDRSFGAQFGLVWQRGNGVYTSKIAMFMETWWYLIEFWDAICSNKLISTYVWNQENWMWYLKIYSEKKHDVDHHLGSETCYFEGIQHFLTQHWIGKLHPIPVSGPWYVIISPKKKQRQHIKAKSLIFTHAQISISCFMITSRHIT